MLFASMPMVAFADDGVEEVDQDVAAMIALLFVLANLENSAWDMTTTIDSITPFYNNDDTINAYCINLKTSAGAAGYVIVSTDLNKPLIQEFSDTASALTNATYEDSQTITSNCVDANSNRIYYYGPLNYTYSKKSEAFASMETSATAVETADDTGNDYYSSACRLISMIHDADLALSGSYTTNEVKITNPLEYLAERYPSATITNVDYYNIGDSSIYGYYISFKNACAIYATAAIIKYYASQYSFNYILSICLQYAEDLGYAEIDDGITDYYLNLRYYKAFTQTCMSYFGLSLESTTYAPYAWALGTEEISNDRPIFLNIANSEQCSDHTVTAFAWTVFDVSGSEYRFFKVIDGRYIGGESVYINYETVNISCITMFT